MAVRDSLARIAQGIGFSWGFRMWSFDRPHLQYTQGITISQFKKGKPIRTGEAGIQGGFDESIWRSRKRALKSLVVVDSRKNEFAIVREYDATEDRQAVRGARLSNASPPHFMVDSLKGYKTYIFAVCIGLLAAAQYLGFIDDGTAQLLYGLFGSGGLAALRAGVAKAE